MQRVRIVNLYVLFCMLLGVLPVLANNQAYVVEDKGRFVMRTLLDRKEDSAQEQMAYATKLRETGHLRKAGRAYYYLVRHWPNSDEAPISQRARADIFMERNNLKDAFKAYQYLIDNYAGRMKDYHEVIEKQFEIADTLMNRRRMRWIFGGFRSPEYAVEYFEDVISNAPQSYRAAEAQYKIGEAHMEADELEEAIMAFGELGYRYPNSEFAELAHWKKIVCYESLYKDMPYSLDVLDEMLTASTVFLTTYPKSEYREQVIELRNRLYEVKAKRAFDEAAFYQKVPKKMDAAKLCFEQMIEEYPKSKLVPEAQERIAELERLIEKERRLLEELDNAQ